jgi:transposase
VVLASFLRHETMGRAFSDDLRCRILEAYARGGVSLRLLAERYAVSFEYVRKIRKQQLRSGRLERVRQRRHGPERRVTAEVAGRIRDEVARRPDVTLDELGHWIADQAGVRLSRSLVWLTLTRLGLPMKKSRSTPSNAIPRSTSSGESNSSTGSARSRPKS